jgi:glyoxylase-like metal-dependent hydrolase (beta-lactamase superfamily II)
MRIGDWDVRCIVDARFALDGGSMFGVVPKPLWQRATRADDRNRIPLVSRLLLLQGQGRRVLVDTGLGDRWHEKPRDIYAIEPVNGGVMAALHAEGIEPPSITDVILTHLHFDHAAGTVREQEGELRLSFPAANHYVQRRQWEWAQAPTLKDQASFRPDDFALLGEPGAPLKLLDGTTELFPGIEVEPLEGHTAGMQAVRVFGAESSVLFAADLVPTAAHVALPYIMGYDNRPLRTLREKRRWLTRAADHDWIVVLEHDPEVEAVRLEMHGDAPRISERISL